MEPAKPQVATQSTNQPLAVYLRFVTASAGLLLGLPIVYVILDSCAAPQNAVIHGLEVAGVVLRGLAMLVFWAILLAIREYSPTLSIVLDVLGVVLEALFMLLG